MFDIGVLVTVSDLPVGYTDFRLPVGY